MTSESVNLFSSKLEYEGCYVNLTIWLISLVRKLKCVCVIYQRNEIYVAYMIVSKR